MPLASNISGCQDCSLRGSSEDRDNPSLSFHLAEVNLTPSGPAIALPFLSRATPTRYNIDITWSIEISPKARAHCHRMEGKRGTKHRDEGGVEETP